NLHANDCLRVAWHPGVAAVCGSPAASLRRAAPGGGSVLSREVRGVDQTGRTGVPRLVYHLASSRGQTAAGRDCPPARLRRGLVPIGAERRVRPALAGTRQKEWLRAAGPFL